MSGTPLARAFVEIRPDTSRVKPEADAALKTIDGKSAGDKAGREFVVKFDSTITEGLKAVRADVKVIADSAEAVARMEAVKLEMDKIDRQKVDIKIRTDSAQKSVGDLDRVLKGVGNGPGGGGGGFGGAAGAAGSAGGFAIPGGWLGAGIAAGITLIGPAAGSATAALGGMAAAGGTAFLVFKGLQDQQKQGTVIGGQLTTQIGGITKELDRLENVASTAAGPGVVSALKQIRAFLPSLESPVAGLATSLGRAFGVGTGGLIQGLKVAGPLLGDAGHYAESLAASFARFTASEGFKKFIDYSRQELPIVGAAVGSVGHAVIDLGIATAPVGDALVKDFGDAADAVDKLQKAFKLDKVSQFIHYLSGGNLNQKTGLPHSMDDLAAKTQNATQAQVALSKTSPVVYAAMKTTKDSVQVLGDQLHLTSKQVENYAGMVGITKDQVDSGALAEGRLAAAVKGVESAYNSATQTGSAFLSSLDAFSKSAGTAADRGALIGAVLKASQGDALSYAGSMVNAATANQNLTKSFDKAQRSAVNWKTGVIDFNNAAAGPLIMNLQAMQDAATAAASATYQHEVATKGARKAALDAADVFKNQTYNALLADAKALGITGDQAKALADRYFSMPKSVTTTVLTAGEKAVNDTLNKIGKQLSFLTHQPWNPVVTVKVDQNAVADAWRTLNGFATRIQVPIGPIVEPAGRNQVPTGPLVGSQTAKGPNAAGTNALPDGWSTAGEQGWEAIYKSGSNVKIFSNKVSQKIMPQGPGIPAFAAGTSMRGVYASVGTAAAPGGSDALLDRIDALSHRVEFLAKALASRPVVLEASGQRLATVVNDQNKILKAYR